MTRPRCAHVWLNKASVLTCGNPDNDWEGGMGGGGTEGGTGGLDEV